MTNTEREITERFRALRQSAAASPDVARIKYAALLLVGVAVILSWIPWLTPSEQRIVEEVKEVAVVAAAAPPRHDAALRVDPIRVEPVKVDPVRVQVEPVRVVVKVEYPPVPQAPAPDRVSPPRVPKPSPQSSRSKQSPIIWAYWVYPDEQAQAEGGIRLLNSAEWRDACRAYHVQLGPSLNAKDEVWDRPTWREVRDSVGTPPLVAWLDANGRLLNWSGGDGISEAITAMVETRGRYP